MVLIVPVHRVSSPLAGELLFYGHAGLLDKLLNKILFVHGLVHWSDELIVMPFFLPVPSSVSIETCCFFRSIGYFIHS